MRISVTGCGYLGAVHAAAMAALGHDVVGIDVDEGRIAALAAGLPPIYEPGLDAVLEQGLASGRLRFTTDPAQAAGCRVHFVAVGTPQRPGSNAADLRYVDAAIAGLVPYLSAGDLVAGKSTVPVGTAARLASVVEPTGAMLAWNPEFLREGFAVDDTLHPDRLVYGLPPADEDAAASRALLDEVYAATLADGTPLVVADYATAELVKVAANAFLATKISFINAMSEITEVVGADVGKLADAIGYDPRIGRRFLGAGIGFGGGCLPKDIRAFAARADELGRGESLDFLRQVDIINLRRRERVVDMVVEELGGQVFQKKVAVLGLAFKPDSDDIRDSPALDVAVKLKGLGAHVIATDPQAIPNAIRQHPQLGFATDTVDALHHADAIVLATEWDEYRELEPTEVAQLARGRVIVDGRNVLDPAAWSRAGWVYRGMGRPRLAASELAEAGASVALESDAEAVA